VGRNRRSDRHRLVHPKPTGALKLPLQGFATASNANPPLSGSRPVCTPPAPRQWDEALETGSGHAATIGTFKDSQSLEPSSNPNQHPLLLVDGRVGSQLFQGNLRCRSALPPESGVLSVGLPFLRQRLPQQPEQQPRGASKDRPHLLTRLVQFGELWRQEHVRRHLEAFHLEQLSRSLRLNAGVATRNGYATN
jgi:hypothetical protein